jgi:hypothetical protein
VHRADEILKDYLEPQLAGPPAWVVLFCSFKIIVLADNPLIAHSGIQPLEPANIVLALYKAVKVGVEEVVTCIGRSGQCLMDPMDNQGK